MSVPNIGGQAKVLSAFDSAAVATGDQNTTGALKKGFHYGFLVANAGTMPTAGATVKVQESDALGSGYTDVTGAVATFAASTTGTLIAQVNLDTLKPYVRLVVNGLGATLSAVLIGYPCRDTENYSPDSLSFDV